MQKVCYQIATRDGFESGIRNGYIYEVTASSGLVVPFVLTQIYGEWFGDHLPTGYAIQNLRAKTRKALIEKIDKHGVSLADKALETSAGIPVLN